MARLPRVNLPGIAQHVIQRGNNRQACFYEHTDYKVYLDKLREYSQKYHVEIHAFILMTNHTHLLLTPTTSNGISQLMQALGRYYVRYFNTRHNRTGTLWEGRYKAALIDCDRYFLTVMRYIELNPVRAGMVTNPAQYPWSSYQENALGKNIKMISYHPCYLALSKNEITRREAYLTLFEQQISEQRVQEIRESTYYAWVIGDADFSQQITSLSGRRCSPSQRGGDHKSDNFRKEQHKGKGQE